MQWTDYIDSLIAGPIAGIAGWWAARRKNKAEVSRSEIENIEKVATLWRETAERLDKQVEELRLEVQTLRKEVDLLHKENMDLKRELEE
ncbi:MAG TPA: hypothetical protein VKP88_04570 [Candidatus Paceibacterota bacterium]|nr:hypothetical protein [Candidatus Paceibacterota bacterium]